MLNFGVRLDPGARLSSGGHRGGTTEQSMKKLLLVLVLLSPPPLTAMTPEVFAEIAGSLCKEHPEEALCREWQLQQQGGEAGDSAGKGAASGVRR